MNYASSPLAALVLLAICVSSLYSLIRAREYVRATGKSLLWRQIASVITLAIGGGFLFLFIVTKNPSMIGYGYLFGVAVSGIPMVISLLRREKVLF